MKFICFSHWAALPESADALFAQAEKDSVFFSRAWFENLTEHGLKADQSLQLACVVGHNRVLAILPLLDNGNGYWHSLCHLYTSLYTLLLADENQADSLQCLAKGLKQLPLHSLRLDPVASDDANLHQLQSALEAEGFTSQRHFRFYNWLHPLRGASFSDYMAARPSRVRNTIRRKQRKLAREHPYQIQLFTTENLSQAMTDYNAAYAGSWKANELFEPFVEGMAARFSKKGWLRLAVLYIQDQPAAAQFWFVAHGKASIFKLVYDQNWKHYSPGSILIAYLMAYVIDTDKVDEIDFLTGNDAYKQDWMTERRTRMRLYFINPHYQAQDKKPAVILWLKKLFKRA